MLFAGQWLGNNNKLVVEFHFLSFKTGNQTMWAATWGRWALRHCRFLMVAGRIWMDEGMTCWALFYWKLPDRASLGAKNAILKTKEECLNISGAKQLRMPTRPVIILPPDGRKEKSDGVTSAANHSFNGDGDVFTGDSCSLLFVFLFFLCIWTHEQEGLPYHGQIY